jgi:hypothetical protein
MIFLNFDIEVLKIKWKDILVGKKPNHEDINTLKNIKKETENLIH